MQRFLSGLLVTVAISYLNISQKCLEDVSDATAQICASLHIPFNNSEFSDCMAVLTNFSIQFK